MIKRLLENGKVFIGRNGSIEMNAMINPSLISSDVMERHTGIWSDLQEWRSAYLNANRGCDVIAAGWYAPLSAEELELLKQLNPNAIIVPLRALEPYYEPDESQRWTQCLRGKRVAVVNSFVDTMMKQLLKRERVWGVSYDSLLPNATYLFYKTGFSPRMAGTNKETCWPQHITDWRSAVSDIVKTVMANSPDIVLIGCGGLSMIVADELKKRNISKKAAKAKRGLTFSAGTIVMGGAIQVLFGIKGNRWENHPIIGRFWNENWVYPSREECPELSYTVENGCYFG